MLQRLREVDGDDQKTINTPVYNVNGKQLNENEFHSLQEDKSKKIIETKPGEYKVLNHLRG